RVGGERGAVLRVPVVDRDGTDLPVAGGEELQDVAGDDARADDGQPSGDAPAGEPLRGEDRGGGRAGGADLRGLQAGEGVARLVVVEQQGRRGARDTAVDVGGEAADPLDAGHVGAGAQVGEIGRAAG